MTHQMLDEVPSAALRSILREAHRVFRPGGRLVVLDFHSPGGPFATMARCAHSRRIDEWIGPPECRSREAMARCAHSRRIDEVFMGLFAETHVSAKFAAAGFAETSLRPIALVVGVKRLVDWEGVQPVA